MAEPVGVDNLARRAAISPRQFARRFVSATGTAPHQWLATQRVRRAQILLETTDLPVEAVAERSGLGDAGNLRKVFRRHVRTTPTAYRATFRGGSGAKPEPPVGSEPQPIASARVK